MAQVTVPLTALAVAERFLVTGAYRSANALAFAMVADDLVIATDSFAMLFMDPSTRLLNNENRADLSTLIKRLEDIEELGPEEVFVHLDSIKMIRKVCPRITDVTLCQTDSLEDDNTLHVSRELAPHFDNAQGDMASMALRQPSMSKLPQLSRAIRQALGVPTKDGKVGMGHRQLDRISAVCKLMDEPAAQWTFHGPRKAAVVEIGARRAFIVQMPTNVGPSAP